MIMNSAEKRQIISIQMQSKKAEYLLLTKSTDAS